MLSEVQSLLNDPSRGLVKEVRKGQLAMAERVAKTLQGGGVTFIEAPVGTGKSLAYLVPASLSAGRTVVTTAKKSLQDQLLQSDIPAVRQATKSLFHFTVLKGANNYYCRAQGTAFKTKPENRAAITRWEGDRTFLRNNGDVAYLPTAVPDFWSQVTARDCEGPKCEYAPMCGYMQALQAASEAKMVVTNHHVLAHTFVRGTDLFGQYDTLVVDEGHQFEEALRGAQTHRLSLATFRLLDGNLTDAGIPRLTQGIHRTAQDLFDSVRNVSGKLPEDRDLAEAAALEGACVEKLAVVDGYLKQKSGDASARRALAAAANFLTQTARTLKVLADTDRSDNLVVHVSRPDWRSQDREIVIEPIEVGGAARESMDRIRSVVVTSATLAACGSFRDAAMSCGLPPPGEPPRTESLTPPFHAESTSLVVASPFDYGKQAVLYTPQNVLMPVTQPGAERDAWLDSVAEEIKRLVEASKGNAFVLFTSASDQSGVYHRLANSSLQYPLILQKQGEAADAERRYHETPHAVLLGLRSFFEGVNIPGDKLWLVIIPKLPFPVPTDPVHKARMDRLADWYQSKGADRRDAELSAFRARTIPAMLVDLRQAVGRLIRTTTDVGVCAILDPRIWTGSGSRRPNPSQTAYEGYGATIVRELGFPRRTSKFENIQAYYGSLMRR